MTTSDYYSGVRSDVLALLPGKTSGNVLEIGGGEFETLRALTTTSVIPWGVDIRRPADPPANFVLGSVTDPDVAAQLPDGGFDLIIANDVIEHVLDTTAFVAVLARKLRADGLLLLSVPNVRQLRVAYHVFIRGTFPREDSGLFDRTHLRWFCRSDVRSIFGAAGFEVLREHSVGRLVPRFLDSTIVGELLGLQNIFLMRR